jgi:TMEM175 potassium channel family protein
LPRDEDIPSRSLGTTRLEAFSDGVFAIAITLLVLEIALNPPGTPLEQVLNAWPSYLAYVVSFLTIGGAWLGHTALTDRLARADPILLRLNLLLLLFVAFLPFPTRLVAEALHDFTGFSHGERVYVLMYGLTLLTIRLLDVALDEYARLEHLYSQQGEGEELESARRSLLAVVLLYVVAILTGLAWPGVAVVFYFGIAVYLVVPFRELKRFILRRS